MPFVELNLKEINNEMLELAATEGLLFVEQAKAVVVEGEIKEAKKEADEKSRAGVPEATGSKPPKRIRTSVRPLGAGRGDMPLVFIRRKYS